MAFDLWPSLVAAVKSSTSFGCVLWPDGGHLGLVAVWSGVPEEPQPQHSEGRRPVSMREVRRRDRRLDFKFGLASVCQHRGAWRSCIAKVSGVSGELRPVLFRTRPTRAPSHRACSIAASLCGPKTIVAQSRPGGVILNNERRFMKRMEHRTSSRPSGCRSRHQNLLLSLDWP